MLPNIFSQGQLFAFSALDGESYTDDDFVGLLCSDKIGIRFLTKIVRELVFINVNRAVYDFDAVTGDYICVRYGDGETVKIIYADYHTIIGTKSENHFPLSQAEGVCESYSKNGAFIQKAYDEYTALYTADDRFVYAFGKSEEEVLGRVQKGLLLDLNTEENKKLSFYEKHSIDVENEYSQLYTKCLSTMKTQLYSPEGVFKRIWSTPDRRPHRHLWLWDSVFHAIGFRNIDPVLAEGLVLAIFDMQEKDGFIPHYSTARVHSDITQPPVIAWGALKVFEKSQNKEFLQSVFDNNKRFLSWCRENRRLTEKELYTWNTQSDKNCRCDESGMDNSPRFDTAERLFAIDFSCFMANETRAMQKIAEMLGLEDEKTFFEEWHNKIKEDINAILWCEQDGFYYDFIILEGKHHKVSSVASFLPLFAGVCNKEQGEALYSELTNPETFCTEFAIPSISKKDPTFGSDMWRGPVWINYNYMISDGLGAYGYGELAEEIISKTIKVLNFWYLRTGTIFEYYDPENIKAPKELNRKGKPLEPYDITIKNQAIREYGWSNTLLFDMLSERCKK